MMDASKQCFGAGIAHLANLVISITFAHRGGSDEVRRLDTQPL